VRDIGRVEVGAADYGSTSYMDRSDATALLIYAQPGEENVAPAGLSIDQNKMQELGHALRG